MKTKIEKQPHLARFCHELRCTPSRPVALRRTPPPREPRRNARAAGASKTVTSIMEFEASFTIRLKIGPQPAVAAVGGSLWPRRFATVGGSLRSRRFATVGRSQPNSLSQRFTAPGGSRRNNLSYWACKAGPQPAERPHEATAKWRASAAGGCGPRGLKSRQRPSKNGRKPVGMNNFGLPAPPCV